jgi:hypothetical protein
MSDEQISITKEQIDELRKQAIEKAKKARHEWRQKGGWIVCRTCDFEHGFRVKSNQRLVGIDEEGKPIIKNLT